MSEVETVAPASLTAPQRALSFAEFAIGAAIVIGHNVFLVVPNEVPILFVLCLLSVRLREGGFPRPWSRASKVLVADHRDRQGDRRCSSSPSENS